MIVVFQIILYTGHHLIKSVYTKLIKSADKTCVDDTNVGQHVIYHGEPAVYDPEAGIRFCPPLYVQRYSVVKSIIKDPKWCGKITKVSSISFRIIFVNCQ